MLFTPSSPPNQRVTRPKLRNGSIGNGSHSTLPLPLLSPPPPPTKTNNGHACPSHAPSLFSNNMRKTHQHQHRHRKTFAIWSGTTCTKFVWCLLLSFMALTMLVNFVPSSSFVSWMMMQPDPLLEPQEPLEYLQLQQEMQQQQQDHDHPGAFNVMVQPHLGPLPKRRQKQQQQQQQQRGNRRHANDQQQQLQQQGAGGRHQARFRGQQQPQPPNQQQQLLQQFWDGPMNNNMNMMMMMMNFRAVEVHDNQLLKRNKYGQVVFRPLTNVSQSDLELDDRFLPDDVDHNTTAEEQDARAQRQELLDILAEAGVKNLDLATVLSLPTSEQLLQLYGPGPAIFGEDSCFTFQQQVPAWDASMGPAGLFNTGTNPLAMYLEANCIIPTNRQRNHGMRWQVPWGKHMLASRKWTNTAQNDYTVNKKHVMPIVMIRDPYMWMQSLCKHPYATKWYRSKAHCPSLVPTLYDRFLFPWIRSESLVVRVWKGTKWPSLAHLWTDWYQQYYRADYPRLIVRFEDLIYHPRQLIERICKCGGGVLRSDQDGTPFTYVVDSGKWGPAHGGKRTNLVSAMIKYGTDKKRFYNLTKADLQLAFEALDPEMMQIFQYAVSAPPA